MAKNIGIDFGTTNSVVSYQGKNGELKQCEYRGDKIIPSAVYYLSKNEYVIGKEAIKRMKKNPRGGVKEFKINIANHDLHIVAEDGSEFDYSYANVARDYLNKLCGHLQATLLKEFRQDGVLKNVVLTVPATFTIMQKDLIKRAACQAGFCDVRLAMEPTAAAVAYEYENSDEDRDEVVLVYDFGGGTFDVTILEKKKGKYSVVVPGGKQELGGRDIDLILLEYFIGNIEEKFDLDLPLDEGEFDESYGLTKIQYIEDMYNIKDEVCRIKESLSESDEEEFNVFLNVPNGRENYCETFTKNQLEKLIENKIEETIDITDRLIQEAQQKGVVNIDRLILAGGSSQIPLVKSKLQERLGDKISILKDDVFSIVSRGAAHMAETGFDSEITGKTVNQFGTERKDGVFSMQFQTIIPENTELPYKMEYKSSPILTKGQTIYEIPVYERDVKNYGAVKRVDQDGIQQIGSLAIELLQNVDVDDIVNVSVVFEMTKEGVLNIDAALIDRQGRKIGTGVNMIQQEQANLE